MLLTLDIRLLDYLQHYLVRPPSASAVTEDDDAQVRLPGAVAAAAPPPPMPVRVSAPLVRLHVVAPRTLPVPELPGWTPLPRACAGRPLNDGRVRAPTAR